jgi:hypothetical protein
MSQSLDFGKRCILSTAWCDKLSKMLARRSLRSSLRLAQHSPCCVALVLVHCEVCKSAGSYWPLKEQEIRCYMGGQLERKHGRTEDGRANLLM